jgi:hypothetical protein
MLSNSKQKELCKQLNPGQSPKNQMEQTTEEGM